MASQITGSARASRSPGRARWPWPAGSLASTRTHWRHSSCAIRRLYIRWDGKGEEAGQQTGARRCAHARVLGAHTHGVSQRELREYARAAVAAEA